MPAHDNPGAGPDLECDVIMKGGITSGVVYPGALCRLGRDYRFRGVGGASAGAIGAALGAAAEFGRSSGGFDKLAEIPGQLGDGQLLAFFQAQPRTRSLLRLLLAATTQGRTGAVKVLALARIMLASHLVAAAMGGVPGAALVAVGIGGRGWAGAVLALLGVVLALVGAMIAAGWMVGRTLTVDVPANLFGICRGLSESKRRGPGFTDWLSQSIDEVAGLDEEEGPLRFGDLVRGATGTLSTSAPEQPHVDLRMMTTCLSQARPYQLPWDAQTFFYDPVEWATLFPTNVLSALTSAPTGNGDPDSSGPLDSAERDWEDALALAYSPALRRLPPADYLPVVVAARMSLSYPLLISAVPMYTIERRSAQTKTAVQAFTDAHHAHTPLPATGLEFVKLWFSDGGLCSNFPLHMFDEALPTRPTYAINLGSFPTGRTPDPDQRNNIEYAVDNRALPPTNDVLPTRGLGAVTGFAAAAINTARNWQDSSLLQFPGFRDRIVRVLQTPIEGGLNLDMTSDTIDGLSKRGEAGAAALVEQFTQARYPAKAPVATGWDNHRWVRYRALMSLLPDFLRAFDAGYRELEIDPARTPSLPLTSESQRQLATQISTSLVAAAAEIASSDAGTLGGLTDAPRPAGQLRRVPNL